IALVFCYFAWFSVVKIFPAGISPIGTLLVPIVGVASGVVVLGEPFGLRDLIALGLIVGAVALVLLVPAGEPVSGRRAPGPR
ncbi:MAG: EamA family transporter, partial [Rhodospirillaceae bacterium]|nr:EamA family transporter [Rhodospirillaceae bacterium]